MHGYRTPRYQDASVSNHFGTDAELVQTLRYRCRSVPRHFGTICFEDRLCSGSEHLNTYKIQLKYLTQVLFFYTRTKAVTWAELVGTVDQVEYTIDAQIYF